LIIIIISNITRPSTNLQHQHQTKNTSIVQLRNATTFVAATASFCFVIASQISSVTATKSLRGGGEGVEDVHILKEEKHGTFLIVSDSMFDLWHGRLTYLSQPPLSRPPPNSQHGLVEYEGNDTVTEETLNIMLEDNSIYEMEDADEDWKASQGKKMTSCQASPSLPVLLF